MGSLGIVAGVAENTTPKRSSGDDLRTLGAGAGIGLVGRVGGRFVHFISQVLLARLLAPAGYGLFSIAWTILRMGAFIAMSGLQNGVIRFGSEQRQTNPANVRIVIRRCLILGLAIGGTLGLAIFLSARWLTASVFEMPGLVPALQILAVSLPLLATARIAASSTRVSQRMLYSVLADELGQPLTFLALLGALVFALGLGLTGALWALTCSYAVSLSLSLVFVRRLFPTHQGPGEHRKPSASPGAAPGFQALIAFSAPTALAAIFSQFILWSDRLFLGYFGTADQVGIYEAIVQLTIPFLVVLAAFNSVIAPMVASLKTEKQRVEQLFRIGTKWGLYCTLPYLLTLVFAGRELIEVLFGGSYSSGFDPLLILALGQLVNVGTGGVAIILIMNGHQHLWLKISGTSFVLNLILNWYLVPRFALVGAALATGAATTVMFVTGVWATYRTLDLWAYDRRYLKGVFATVLTALVLLAAHWAIDLPPIAWVLFTAAASGGTFLTTLRLLGLEPEDHQLLAMIGPRTRAKPRQH